VGKTIKETRNMKTTGDVPWDVLIFWGEKILSLVSQLIKNICETGEWPKVFTEVTMIPLKKRSAAKCKDHRTIGINALSERIVLWILKRRFKRKIEDVLGEDQF
jgi:hypothetical protein